MQPEIKERVKALIQAIKHPGQREMFRSIWKHSKRSALRYAELVCFAEEVNASGEETSPEHCIGFAEEEKERCEAIELQALIAIGLKQEKVRHKLISPQGEEVEISHVTQFCKQLDIPPVNFYRLIKGEYKSVKGWKLHSDTVPPIDKNRAKFQLVSPQGEMHKVSNVSEFCRTHKIHPNRFYCMVASKRYSYKGWRVC